MKIVPQHLAKLKFEREEIEHIRTTIEILRYTHTEVMESDYWLPSKLECGRILEIVDDLETLIDCDTFLEKEGF